MAVGLVDVDQILDVMENWREGVKDFTLDKERTAVCPRSVLLDQKIRFLSGHLMGSRYTFRQFLLLSG